MKYITFKQSYIYELNTRIFCLENRCTLAEFPESFFESPEIRAADYIRRMGIWEPSPASVNIASKHEGLRKDFKTILPDLKENEIIGSPYAIYRYRPNPLCAKSFEEIQIFRDRLQAMGKKLILDFVPNHMAVDTPLLDTHPGLFLQKNGPACRNSFERNGKVFYHGKDPYFDGWTDTVQWDFSNPETLAFHKKILGEIASVCDGVRCDMAMLPLIDIFEKTHGKKAKPYWTDLIQSVKLGHPKFIFIAEVYWNLEYHLQTLGFDYTYDKTLYDRLKEKNLREILGHLNADPGFQEKSLRFIENHDEQRAYATFAQDSVSDFSLLCFLPGMILYHDGQDLGVEYKVPVQLSRIPDEEVKSEILAYYIRAFRAIASRKEKKLKIHHNHLHPYGEYDLSDVVSYTLVEDTNDPHLEILIYNFYPHEIKGRLEIDDEILEKLDRNGIHDIRFIDVSSEAHYIRSIDDLMRYGLYIHLMPGQVHWFVKE